MTDTKTPVLCPACSDPVNWYPRPSCSRCRSVHCQFCLFKVNKYELPYENLDREGGIITMCCTCLTEIEARWTMEDGNDGAFILRAYIKDDESGRLFMLRIHAGISLAQGYLMSCGMQLLEDAEKNRH